MQNAVAYLYYFLQFPDSSFKERPIRRVDFRPIESKRPRFQNVSSIGSRTVKTAMLIFDVDSGPYCNNRSVIGCTLAFGKCAPAFRVCIYKCMLVGAGADGTGHIVLRLPLAGLRFLATGAMYDNNKLRSFLTDRGLLDLLRKFEDYCASSASPSQSETSVMEVDQTKEPKKRASDTCVSD
ncbi:hypothetical protein EVAR_53005_1 [Eumeta japonica]|uniref:Uncharacterized protein n=1 Tax=Eumeta variegata TaxID=151549 RepID=A0A4C1YIZ8_EUMVA|nr:hypothetical protein EVAR_53005_1 [Eumeta japonica]